MKFADVSLSSQSGSESQTTCPVPAVPRGKLPLVLFELRKSAEVSDD